MSGLYGWTYANQLNPGMRRGGRKNRYQPERRKARRLNSDKVPGADWSFAMGRGGRIAVAVVLVVLSLVVLGKEPALEATVEQAVAVVWDRLGQTLGWNSGTKDPLAAAPVMPASEETVVMAVKPQVEPKALLLDRNLFALDKNGMVWSLPDDAVSDDLPIITGLTVREEPGKMGMRLEVEYDAPLIDAILGVPYIGQISEIHVGSPEGVVLFTRDGIKVLIRKKADLDQDLKRLGAVIGDIRVKDKRVALVDLRYHQHVVVRPKRRR